MFEKMRVFLIFLLSLLYCMSCTGQVIDYNGNQIKIVTNERYSFEAATASNLRYLEERLGFCSNCFQYIRIDDFIIGKLTLPNLKMGDTVKAQFFYKDINLNMVIYSEPIPRPINLFHMNNYTVYKQFNFNISSKFSIKSDNCQTFNGSLLPEGSSQEIINQLQNGQAITYRIDFPISQGIPNLEGIFINDNELCGSTFPLSEERLILQHTLQDTNGPISVFKYNINIPHFIKSSTCGLDDTEITSSGLTSYIQGGTIVRRGEYPWLTAIYRNENDVMTFICGGSLLTSKFILTAAHCFSKSELSQQKIVVHLGNYNLSNSYEDSIEVREIKDVIFHPEYSEALGFSDADLALLEMQDPVSFTQFIKPICLWSETADEALIVNSTGVVAGWGSDENNNAVTAVPKKAKTTIVSYSECLRSSPVFSAITSPRTLCAGKRDGSGPCVGDSGGGLMLNRNGHWMLRGVISAGLSLNKQCDLSEYTVYCDVAKHLPWLEKKIGHQAEPITGTIENICGKSGTEIRSKHPWLAAIYKKQSTGLLFYCTGVLISSRTVLAPAHCIDLPDGDAVDADYMRIYLGRYDLNNIYENEVVSREVETYIRHPKYKFSLKIFYDSDILLFQMKTPISFTEHIRPICLWNGRADQSELAEQSATLASWDVLRVYNESLTVPQSSEVKIVPIRECQLVGYNAGTTTRFLCTPRFGNNVDGILMIERNGRWQLRGLSSANLFYIFRYNSRDFRVYSDLVDYVPWIKSKMLS